MTSSGDRVFLKAPPKTEILVYYSQYGNLNGFRTESRSRVWLIAESQEPDAALKAIVGVNDPDTGRPVYDTYDVTAAVIRSAHLASIQITLADGNVLSQTVAPCVCGAGAIGYAGPTEDRHTILMLNPQHHNQIQTP